MPSSLGSSGLKPAWPSAPSRVPCPHSLPMSLYHTTISLLSLILGHLLWFFSLNYLKNNLSAMMGGAQRMPESPGPRALSFTEVGWELRSLAYTFGVLPSISTNDTYTTFSSCSCCLFTECSFWHFSPPPTNFLLNASCVPGTARAPYEHPQPSQPPGGIHHQYPFTDEPQRGWVICSESLVQLLARAKNRKSKDLELGYRAVKPFLSFSIIIVTTNTTWLSLLRLSKEWSI